jgi:5-methylcytosine-specific restriction protein A
VTPPRVVTVCAEPGCPALAVRAGRCRQHARPPWQGSKQRRLDAGLAEGNTARALRHAVRRRARHRCEACGSPVPLGAGAVDHRQPLADGGPARDLVNLELLCDRCHDAKTRDERARGKKNRAPEKNPRGVGDPPAPGARVSPTGAVAARLYGSEGAS